MPAEADFEGAPPYPLGDAVFRFAYSEVALYVDVQVTDAEVLAEVSGRDDPGAVEQDSVEIVIDAAAAATDTQGVTHVVVSAANGVFDARGLLGEEDAGVDLVNAQVESVADGWRVTFAIDSAVAMVRAEGGEVLAFDFAVHDTDAVGEVASTEDWSGLSDVAQRECWSRLQLVGSGDPVACSGGYERKGGACVQAGEGCLASEAGDVGSAALPWPLILPLALLRRGRLTRRGSRRPGGWRRPGTW